MDKMTRTWTNEEVHIACRKLDNELPETQIALIPVPRGGRYVAQCVKDVRSESGYATTIYSLDHLTLPDIQAVLVRIKLASVAPSAVYFVEDIVDTGITFNTLAALCKNVGLPCRLLTLVYKGSELPQGAELHHADTDRSNTWHIFPWEKENDKVGERQGTATTVTVDNDCTFAADWRAVVPESEYPNLEGMRERCGRMMREVTQGYHVDIPSLFKVFTKEHFDQMVTLRNIEFASTCEHHGVPFFGKAFVSYIPRNGQVIGVSKMARLVHAFAQRLQLQERMTQQIAETIMQHLNPIGVGVVVVGRHSCMSCRGVLARNADMVTNAMLGVYRHRPQVRQEFLDSIQHDLGAV
jgi:GTP cyclohydrolase IA